MANTWTQAHIDALTEAVASGVLTVTYGGGTAASRTITYQSLAAMRELLAEMVAQVGDAAGTRRKRRYVSTNKGFC